MTVRALKRGAAENEDSAALSTAQQSKMDRRFQLESGMVSCHHAETLSILEIGCTVSEFKVCVRFVNNKWGSR